MKINIEKVKFGPLSFIIGPILLNFHTICKIEKETLFVPEKFSI